MFTTSNFYQLTYNNQADILLKEGTYLQTRKEAGFVVDLYELDTLLVEVFYQLQTDDIVSIMAYNSSDKNNSLTRGLRLAPKLTFKQPVYLRNEICA